MGFNSAFKGLNEDPALETIICKVVKLEIQWKPLIMITLGLALFDNNNRLITLSGGFKNLHYLTQFIVTVQPFTIKIRGLNC
jgi:hypothetical protein